jgi:hypothetical protein
VGLGTGLDTDDKRKNSRASAGYRTSFALSSSLLISAGIQFRNRKNVRYGIPAYKAKAVPLHAMKALGGGERTYSSYSFSTSA